MLGAINVDKACKMDKVDVVTGFSFQIQKVDLEQKSGLIL